MKAIITISDCHIGSFAGLCPPEGYDEGEGTRFMPSKIQLYVWRCWLHFWKTFVPQATAGAQSVSILINGDIIDGVHHNATNIISHSWGIQEKAAVGVLKPLRRIGPIRVTRGTEAHGGASGEAEEAIAEQIGAEKNDIGEFTNWQWWVDLDGYIFQFAHHIGTTSSAAYETSAPMREMVAGMVESVQWGQPMPDMFVRSHRHRFIFVPIPSEDGRITITIIPGWQLRTPFIEKIDRMRLPHIGGVVFQVENKRCQVLEKIYPLPKPQPVKV